MFRYNDHGVDIYGNGLVVPEALATAEPEMLRALVRVTLQGIRDVLSDPAAASQPSGRARRCPTRCWSMNVCGSFSASRC